MKTPIPIISYLILTFSALISCSKPDNIEKVFPEPNATYWDYSLKLEKSTNTSTVNTATFTPKGSCIANGKIYITNSSENRLEILDASTGSPTAFIKDWTFNGISESFNNPTDVCVNNGRIYVANYKNFRIEVFDEKTRDFISCIGTNPYPNHSILEPFSIRVSGNKIFVLTRDNYIFVFNVDEISASTYKAMKTKAYLLLSSDTTLDRAYAMDAIGDKLYVADKIDKKILVYNIGAIDFNNVNQAKKTNAIQAITSFDLQDKTAIPSGLAIYNDSRIFLSYNNKSYIDVIDKNNGSIIATCNYISATPLTQIERIFIQNKTLLISDKNNKFHQTIIGESSIKEYN